MKTLVRLICVAALLPATTAHAVTDRAEFEKWCQRGSSVAVGRCLGYLLAAEDVLATDSIEGVRACLPRDVTLQDEHRIVMAWLAENPAATSVTAMGLVAHALAAHYPCGK